jgi:hypothetical protein
MDSFHPIAVEWCRKQEPVAVASDDGRLLAAPEEFKVAGCCGRSLVGRNDEDAF